MSPCPIPREFCPPPEGVLSEEAGTQYTGTGGSPRDRVSSGMGGTNVIMKNTRCAKSDAIRPKTVKQRPH